MRRVLNMGLVLGLAVALGACSSTWSSSNTTRAGGPVSTEAKTPMSQIIVTEEDISDRPYRVLGDLNVTVNKTTIFNADPTREHVNEELREEAYELGADAVILVRYGSVGISMMSWGALDGKGRAVAFTE